MHVRVKSGSIHTGRRARWPARRGSWCHRRGRGLGNESARGHVRSRGRLVKLESVSLPTMRAMDAVRLSV